MYQEIRFEDYKGREIVLPSSSIVDADGDLLPLCAMCKKSRMTCENIYIREIQVPLRDGDDPNDEVIGDVRQPDGSYLRQRLGYKIVDGVATGLIKSEDDIPIPVACTWFEQKDLG